MACTKRSLSTAVTRRLRPRRLIAWLWIRLAPITGEQQQWLAGLIERGEIDTVRAMPNMLGTCVEASFPAMVGLAALALSRDGFYRPADETGFETPLEGAPDGIVVKSWGNWRGEGMGLVEPAS